MMTKQELKFAEAAAIEGLTGADRKAAKMAFYNANKEAIRAANDAEAAAGYDAATAPTNTLIAAAAAKGLTINVTANIGYLRGNSREDVVLVTGGAFAVKEILKINGARWLADQKAWALFVPAFETALAAI